MRTPLLFLVLASCTHDLSVYDRVEVKPARDIDILYVFDNSSDRGTYDKMASQLDLLQSRLSEIDGQLPNLHVGVTTTDLGTRGTKDIAPRPPVVNCAGEGGAGNLITFNSSAPLGSYLEDLRGPDGSRARNYATGNLSLELGLLTNPQPGTANNGCEFEQPLEAMRRALDPETNPGFIRDGAMLSVVFLTNEDDCSFQTGALLEPNDPNLGPLASFRCTEQGVICDEPDPRRPGVRTNCRPREDSQYIVPVGEYKTFLEKYKKNSRDVVVSAVAGPRNPFEVGDIAGPKLLPSCQGAGGSGWPAVRIGAIVDSFGGALVDNCSQDNAYQQITTPILNRQRSCFANLTKDDGQDCRVTETAGGKATELPRCADGGGGATPCWSIFTDAAACPAGDNLGITVRRTAAAPAGARVEATCFVK
jgi:hypothetical protein